MKSIVSEVIVSIGWFFFIFAKRRSVNVWSTTIKRKKERERESDSANDIFFLSHRKLKRDKRQTSIWICLYTLSLTSLRCVTNSVYFLLPLLLCCYFFFFSHLIQQQKQYNCHWNAEHSESMFVLCVLTQNLFSVTIWIF